jgi:hypothetical protein
VGALGRGFVQGEVERLFDTAGTLSAPVDLSEIAKNRRVFGVDLRPMVPEGYLGPVVGGFLLFLRDSSSQFLDLRLGPGWQPVKPRQRFTMAHEIAHTLFYDIHCDPPAPIKDTPRIQVLESLCQYGGALILVPDRLLAREIEGERQLTAGMALGLAKRFIASLELVIRRVGEVDQKKTLFGASGLVLAAPDESNEDAMITAAYVGDLLRPYFRSPVAFRDTIRSCCDGPIPAAFWNRESWRGRIKLEGGELSLEKVPRLGGNGFLLEMQLQLT